jgi:hypothetical protein
MLTSASRFQQPKISYLEGIKIRLPTPTLKHDNWGIRDSAYPESCLQKILPFLETKLYFRFMCIVSICYAKFLDSRFFTISIMNKLQGKDCSYHNFNPHPLVSIVNEKPKGHRFIAEKIHHQSGIQK